MDTDWKSMESQWKVNGRVDRAPVTLFHSALQQGDAQALDYPAAAGLAGAPGGDGARADARVQTGASKAYQRQAEV